jgi:hypothetical protein
MPTYIFMGVNAASGTYTKLVDEWYITIDGRFAICPNVLEKKKRPHW